MAIGLGLKQLWKSLPVIMDKAREPAGLAALFLVIFFALAASFFIDARVDVKVLIFVLLLFIGVVLVLTVLNLHKKTPSSSSPYDTPHRVDDTPVHQSAAVCYRKNDGAIQFLLVRTSGGRWTFPKGGIEKGELLARAAEREAYEEAGVRGAVQEKPLTVYKHLKSELKREGTELNVAAFLLEVSDTQPPLEKNRDPTWFSLNNSIKVLAEHRSFKYADEFRRVINEASDAVSRTG